MYGLARTGTGHVRPLSRRHALMLEHVGPLYARALRFVDRERVAVFDVWMVTHTPGTRAPFVELGRDLDFTTPLGERSHGGEVAVHHAEQLGVACDDYSIAFGEHQRTLRRLDDALVLQLASFVQRLTCQMIQFARVSASRTEHQVIVGIVGIACRSP